MKHRLRVDAKLSLRRCQRKRQSSDQNYVILVAPLKIT